MSSCRLVSLYSLLLNNVMPSILLQVEVHPYFRNDGLLKYCASKNIHVTAYAPVSSPASMQSQGLDVPNLLAVRPVVTAY